MGLHHTAHYLKSKGRGNDTMLVHMTPGEVKGLQALAMAKGGSLTVNPQTGLPEAGFLEDILPVVAAAGLTYLTAGAAAPTLTAALGGSTMAGGIAAGALSGALISGGMAAIQGQDAGQAALMGGLGGGIAGGMGAYDAANVFNAPNLLADASQQVVQANPVDAATMLQEGLKVAPTPSAFPTVSPTGAALSVPSPTVPGGFISSETGQLVSTPPPGSGLTMGEMMAGSVRPGPIPPVSQAEAAQAVRTLGGAGNVTGTAPTTFYQDQGTLGRMAIQGLPAIGLLGGSTTPQVGPQDNYVSPLQRLSPNFQAYVPPQPNPYYRPQYPVYGASGGEVKLAAGGQPSGPVERMSMMGQQPGMYPMGMINPTQYATPTQRPASMEIVRSDYDAPVNAITGIGPQFQAGGSIPRPLPKGDAGIYRDTDPATAKQDSFTAALTRMKAMQGRANIKGLPALKAATKPLGNIEAAASGGVMSSIGGYSDGGRMLKGPGDGMSDSIPGVIGGRQPARLADGEFVVPADVVSHLGNGSTDAGARKLYKMMDKIRKARTGRKKQAPAVKADKFIPRVA